MTTTIPVHGALVACIHCRRVETLYTLRINHNGDSERARTTGDCTWQSEERDLFGHLVDPNPCGLVPA